VTVNLKVRSIIPLSVSIAQPEQGTMRPVATLSPLAGVLIPLDVDRLGGWPGRPGLDVGWRNGRAEAGRAAEDVQPGEQAQDVVLLSGLSWPARSWRSPFEEGAA
jgi:hypothetical protein